MWPFDIPAKLSINMYIDGIISHIKALHTSVQPSVNCTVPAPSVGHTVREDSVSMAHTCLLIRGEDSQRDTSGQIFLLIVQYIENMATFTTDSEVNVVIGGGI